MEKQTVKIGPGGRIVIPAVIRARLSLKTGDSLNLTEANGEIHLSSAASGIRKAQTLISQYIPTNVNLVDELIAERRTNAERE